MEVAVPSYWLQLTIAVVIFIKEDKIMTKFEKFIMLLNVSGLVLNVMSATLKYARGTSFVFPLILGILNILAIVLFVATAKAPEETDNNAQ